MAGELTLSTFRLNFSAEKRVILPPLQRGDLIRGFFGISLRKLVCYDLSLDCRRCLLRATCPPSQCAGRRAGSLTTEYADPARPAGSTVAVRERHGSATVALASTRAGASHARWRPRPMCRDRSDRRPREETTPAARDAPPEFAAPRRRSGAVRLRTPACHELLPATPGPTPAVAPHTKPLVLPTRGGRPDGMRRSTQPDAPQAVVDALLGLCPRNHFDCALLDLSRASLDFGGPRLFRAFIWRAVQAGDELPRQLRPFIERESERSFEQFLTRHATQYRAKQPRRGAVPQRFDLSCHARGRPSREQEVFTCRSATR